MLSELSRLSGTVTAGAASFLLTYIVHSTLLVGGTWLLLRYRDLRPAWEETVWKVAMFGPLLTASAHAVADVDPFVDAWDVTRIHPFSVHAAAMAGADAVLDHWLALVTAVWVAGAAVHLARLVRRQRRMLRGLGRRRPVAGGMLRMLTELTVGRILPSRLRLTALAGLGTPLALGLREVVVPEDLAARLDEGSLRAVLAHEVAHLARRDPLWSLATGVVEAVCFFQPLNGLARARLAELAEIRADRWAVRRTGSALAVARGLEEVARGLDGGFRMRRPGLAATGERRSGLLARVRHILDPRPGEERPVGPWARVFTVGSVVAFVLLAVPSFTPIHDSPRVMKPTAAGRLAPPPVATAALPAPVWLGGRPSSPPASLHRS